MTACRGCGADLGSVRPGIVFRTGDSLYHFPCAPGDLLAAASEEYRAIVRKGVRYFVEKYSTLPQDESSVLQGFLALGDAIDQERGRRGGR
jgi:hypothetical protein